METLQNTCTATEESNARVAGQIRLTISSLNEQITRAKAMGLHVEIENNSSTYIDAPLTAKISATTYY